MSSFVLELAHLAQGSSTVRLEADATEIGLDAGAWPGRVYADLQVQRSGERITVRGDIRGVTRLECFRCLRMYELLLEVPFDVFAEQSGKKTRRDEIELERDDYMMFHDGRRLDLREQAREALLLELPIAPHCREDCQGLCPRCGANLNDGPCACLDPTGVQ